MTKLEKALERYACNAEYERSHGNLQGCMEFKQLCEWLKELRAYRKIRAEIEQLTTKNKEYGGKL